MLEKASAFVSETLPEEPSQSKAKAWIRTLVENGFPLREEREPPSEPADGGLLTVQMETEIHVFAIYCLARTVSHDDYLDLAGESSHWAHEGVVSLNRELTSCGFTRSKGCDAQYFSWMSRLGNGSPLFGDDFRTEWSFYTLFSNRDLAAMVPVLQAASDFDRILPEGYPEELVKKMATSLSDVGKDFCCNLVKWFGAIQRAGLDAFILWW